MLFYPSKNNNNLNRIPFHPEEITGRAMVNPHYRVQLSVTDDYIIDSGAFQERDMLQRLQPDAALDRQLALERHIGAPAACIVSYDMLDGVDEAITERGRVKQRGTEESASKAILETIRSARVYKSREKEIAGAIGYACQGVTPEQYKRCAEEIIPLMRKNKDWFCFGGFCIIGIKPSLKPIFYETLKVVLPMIVSAGITRAHILGVTVADAILEASKIAQDYNITISTDSSSPERNGAQFGRAFDANYNGKPQFYQKHQRSEKYTGYHPHALAVENIIRYDEWCKTLMHNDNTENTPHISYQQEYVKCGKERCRKCKEGPGHGPYWYGYYREGGKTKKKYIGKELPPQPGETQELDTRDPKVRRFLKEAGILKKGRDQE